MSNIYYKITEADWLKMNKGKAHVINRYQRQVEEILKLLQEYGINVSLKPIKESPNRLVYVGTLEDKPIHISFTSDSNEIDSYGDDTHNMKAEVSYDGHKVPAAIIDPNDAEEAFEFITASLENELGYETEADKELNAEQARNKEAQEKADKEQYDEPVENEEEQEPVDDSGWETDKNKFVPNGEGGYSVETKEPEITQSFLKDKLQSFLNKDLTDKILYSTKDKTVIYKDKAYVYDPKYDTFTAYKWSVE